MTMTMTEAEFAAAQQAWRMEEAVEDLATLRAMDAVLRARAMTEAEWKVSWVTPPATEWKVSWAPEPID